MKTISKNTSEHVNTYITEKHNSKEKNVFINGFQGIFNNKWKHRKFKFNRLVHDIKRNSFLKQKKVTCFYFCNLVA